jgi:hypothetical protein
MDFCITHHFQGCADPVESDFEPDKQQDKKQPDPKHKGPARDPIRSEPRIV